VEGSWLCRDDTDRERLLDMERHLRPVRTVTMALIIGASLVSTQVVDPSIFPVVLAGVVVASALFWLADAHMANFERPEYVMFAAWAGAELAIAACIVLTGGPDSPGLSWLAIPVVTLSSRFSMRGVLLGVSIALGLLAGSTLAVDAGAVADDPTLLSAPAILILSIAVLSIALMRSDVHHRGAAVIDPLTGMLNRKALTNRAAELAQQSQVSGQPVGLILGDLDHFKRVNDSLGHAAGDAVLTDVAYRLRKRLRAFDLAYRIGGEEFLVLLPGARLDEARAHAEELRHAIESETVGDGVEMTMSFGVSASSEGRAFSYEASFAAADLALYEAKRAGRNCVCIQSEMPEIASTLALEPVAAPIPS
jgi:diguanylate cyclase (GGDEF)-like protein